MYDKSRVNLKNPWVAALLGFLIPGAGHLYQRRMFKAGIYCVCILGTFFSGMALGDWQTCYYRKEPGHTHYGYISQFMVGLPALTALVQAKRYRDFGNADLPQSAESLNSLEFEGYYLPAGNISADEGIPIKGTLSGEIQRTEFGFDLVNGAFIGQRTDNGESFGLTLEGPPQLGDSIAPSPDRMFASRVITEDDRTSAGSIDGHVPRKFWNWFQMPLQDDNLEKLHGSLGKQFDLALVFTWIAGLLNVLAIWDALDGPAYGIGDEPDPTEDEEKKKK